MSPHRELRLAPPLAPSKFRLSQVPGDTIPQGWSGPAAVSEVTDDPGSGRVTPPQAHLPLPAQTILLGVGQRWGGLISGILWILAPSFGVVLDTLLSKSHDPNSLAKIRLWEKVSQKLAFPGLDLAGIKSCHAFGQGLNSKDADLRVKSSQKCKAIYYAVQGGKKT